MAKRIEGKSVARNMILSVTAQMISMVTGFILNLVVPKFISEYDYSYWQTYILYSQYVCFLQFGLLDGFVLKYSKYDYDELNKDSVRSQYYAILFLDVLCMIGLAVVSVLFFDNVTKIILILLAVTIPIEVTYNYVSFTFQMTNRIKEYAKFIIVYGDLNVELLGQGFTWLDTGTHKSLVDATNFVKTVEQHQHRKVGCLEEIAYLNGWISKADVLAVYEVLKKNQYGQYLKDVLDGKYLDVLH